MITFNNLTASFSSSVLGCVVLADDAERQKRIKPLTTNRKGLVMESQFGDSGLKKMIEEIDDLINQCCAVARDVRLLDAGVDPTNAEEVAEFERIQQMSPDEVNREIERLEALLTD